MSVRKSVGMLVAVALIAGLAVGAVAQQNHSMGSMSGDGMSGMPGHDSKMMTDAMDKMNRDMMAAPHTGDADQDFVAMMIPHHQGAIDMAKAVLAHGKDLEIRELAEGIVTAQESEIDQMRAWQKAHPANK